MANPSQSNDVRDHDSVDHLESPNGAPLNPESPTATAIFAELKEATSQMISGAAACELIGEIPRQFGRYRIDKEPGAVTVGCAGFSEAHEAGPGHRDLKPVDIMINRNRQPVIMEFGLVRHHESGRATDRRLFVDLT